MIMIQDRIDIWNTGEYNYPAAFGFYDRGYNCFVLTYTVDLLDAVPLRMQALEDASRAMRLIRTIAPSYYIDPNRITVLGFSAGGHLAASLCVHHQDTIEIDPRLAAASPRPDAAILCYPVITSGELSHPGTIRALLGFSSVDDDFVPEVQIPGAEKWLADNVIPGCTTREEQLNYASLDKHVTPDVPPTFIWHTMEDQSVPVENRIRCSI